MITNWKKSRIILRTSQIKSNIFLDSELNELVIHDKRVLYQNKKFIPQVMYILDDFNIIIASSDDRTKIAQIPLDFMKLYVNKNGFDFALVKYNDKEVFTDLNNYIDVTKTDDNVSIQELNEIAKAYPDDTALGRYVRNELIK